MKRSLSILAISVISLVGLPSCKVDSPTAVEAQQTSVEIRITGSGSTYPAMKILGAAYETKVDNAKISFLPSSQSSSGIAGVKEGLVEIGTISRKLKPKEDDGSLVYQEVARDALLVATHPSVEGVTNLSTEQLQGIYSGAITNWQQLGGADATIVVLDRPEDESAKRLLRQHYLGQELQKAPDAVILRHESDLIAALQSTPYSIGAFSLAYAIMNELAVNRLSLNSIEPTPENVQVGRYPMVRHLGIVFPTTPLETIQEFINFAFSEEGSQQLSKSGFVTSLQN